VWEVVKQVVLLVKVALLLVFTRHLSAVKQVVLLCGAGGCRCVEGGDD
jgi:hypothetical protein